MRHDPDTAQELTQAFFTHLLEKQVIHLAAPERGRFRAFLKVSLRNYLATERIRARAAKRGGARPPLSIEFKGAESRFRLEPGHQQTPEVDFEKSWARTVLSRALSRLRAEFKEPSARERLRHLEPFLLEQPTDLRYRQVAEVLKTSEAAVKVGVHRLRRRFGRALRAEVADTVNDPGQVDDEIRNLLAVVGTHRSCM
jgi:RNA polymerase sigma-70 factor (ECF subfamily)